MAHTLATPAQDNDLELFRDMTVKFLEQEILPHYEDWERDHLMPREFWNLMGEAGLLLVDLPEKYGTAGADFAVAQMIQGEMCRLGLHSLATGYNIHANIVGPYILNLGTEEQKEKWLPKMATGEVVGALGMTEPSAGSDLGAIRTTAVRDGDDYIINGSKIFITNGIHADLVVLAVKTNPGAGAKGISLFLVDASTPGFARGKKIEKMGQHASDTAELFFSDMRVPASSILGGDGRGFFHMMEELPRERLGCAVQAVSHAKGALDLTIDYITERKAFGKSISQFQNTRFKLADIQTELELNTALVEKYMAKFEAGTMTVEDAAVIKLATTEFQLRTIDTCLQMFGGYGYTDEYVISRFYRDARIQTIYGGTSEIMREVIARGLVGR